MKYMMFIKHPDGYEAGGAPPALYAAMGEFIEDAASKGIFIDGAGLQPMEKGARVKLAGGRIEVIDGPFCETKEVVGGYAICELPTREEALALAERFMDLHRIHWPGFEGTAELRPFEAQDG